MRLKERPWKLLAAVAFGTAAMAVGAIDLLDGEITTRQLGRLTISETPLRFVMFVLAYVAACGFVLIGWLSLFDEWNRDYRPRQKTPIDDPEKRRPM